MTTMMFWFVCPQEAYFAPLTGYPRQLEQNEVGKEVYKILNQGVTQ